MSSVAVVAIAPPIAPWRDASVSVSAIPTASAMTLASSSSRLRRSERSPWLHVATRNVPIIATPRIERTGIASSKRLPPTTAIANGGASPTASAPLARPEGRSERHRAADDPEDEQQRQHPDGDRHPEEGGEPRADDDQADDERRGHDLAEEVDERQAGEAETDAQGNVERAVVVGE